MPQGEVLMRMGFVLRAELALKRELGPTAILDVTLKCRPGWMGGWRMRGRGRAAAGRAT